MTNQVVKEIHMLVNSEFGSLFVFSTRCCVSQALVPVTTEVQVPFELHRYIIGQKGSGIRKMMDEFEVCSR